MPNTPGRTATGTRSHARVIWGTLCAYLSDYAALCVPTRGDRQMDSDYYVEVARRFKLIGIAAQFYAVAIMRREGATWDQVARACKLPDAEAAKVIYEAKYNAFVRGERDASVLPGMHGVLPEDAFADLEAEAARLDEWCQAHGIAGGLRAVTDGLY